MAPTSTPSDPSQRFFKNVIPQEIEELKILSANDQIESRIVNLISDIRIQLQLQIDQAMEKAVDVESRIDRYVDKDYVQRFYTKMKYLMSEVTNDVAVMRQAMPERVTKDQLQDVTLDLFRSLSRETETSGGVAPFRCLLCGRPKTSISGMIRDPKVAEAIQDSTETSVAGVGNPAAAGAPGRGTLLYGPDKHIYRGYGNLGKPALASPGEGSRKKSLPVLEKRP
jgi:hypothetical protein